MKSRVDYKTIKGIPPHDFFPKAWESEPLTKMLKEVDISAALPNPDEDISLMAQLDDKTVIAQCSTNRVVKYWDHLANIDASQYNVPTQQFISIHQKAVTDEKQYLSAINEPQDKAFHNAGIAVLPEYRGRNIGTMLTAAALTLCEQNQATTLFCETTNQYSATIMKNLAFFKIKEYPYKELAAELSAPELANSDDSFSVWCKKLGT